MAISKNKCMRKELRDVKICVRVTQKMSKFMKDQKLSPSMIMINALDELGFK
jgi:hypothetical protein